MHQPRQKNHLLMEEVEASENVSLLNRNREPQILSDQVKRRELKQSVAALIKANNATKRLDVTYGILINSTLLSFLLCIASRLSEFAFTLQLNNLVTAQACTPNSSHFTTGTSVRDDFISMCLQSNYSGLLNVSNPNCNASSIPVFCDDVSQKANKIETTDSILLYSAAAAGVSLAIIFLLMLVLERFQGVKPENNVGEINFHLSVVKRHVPSINTNGPLNDVLARIFAQDSSLKPTSCFGKFGYDFFNTDKPDQGIEELPPARAAMLV